MLGCGARSELTEDGTGGAGAGPGTGGAPSTTSTTQASSSSATSAATTVAVSTAISSVASSSAVTTVATTTTGPLCTTDEECQDAIDCTLDTCEPQGCTHVPIDVACDDATFCTLDLCDTLRGCINEPTNDVCDDGLGCTIDTCNRLVDACENDPCDSFCDDGSFCDGVERCDSALGCVDGPSACETGIFCAASSCNEAADTCSHFFPMFCPGPDVHILVTDQNGALWDVAPFETPAQTLIAGASAGSHLDIAVLGNRWFVADSQIRELVPFTNQVITTLWAGSANSLAAGPDGWLYLADTTVFRVHPDTQATELLGSLPPGHNSSGDIAFLGQRMFVSTNSPCGGALVEFDVATGTSWVLGGDGLGCVYGLATIAGVLYIINCDGKVGTFDPDTGVAQIFSTTSVTAYGADALP